MNPITQLFGQRQSKKRKKNGSRKSLKQVGNITPALKRSIWEMHYGPNNNEALCKLCGQATLYKSKNNGFQAAHIVAENFFVGTLNRFDLVPSCASCNNQCDDLCVFQFLYARHRYDALKGIAWTIYTAFRSQYPQAVAEYDNMMWKYIYAHYGAERYVAGGGIRSERAVYDLLRQHQVEVETLELGRLMEEVKVRSDRLTTLLNARIDKRDLL